MSRRRRYQGGSQAEVRGIFAYGIEDDPVHYLGSDVTNFVVSVYSQDGTCTACRYDRLIEGVVSIRIRDNCCQVFFKGRRYVLRGYINGTILCR